MNNSQKEKNMKKIIFITLLLISTILLAACGNTGTETNSNSISEAQPQNVTTFELPLSTKLAVGALKLEDTEFAIASDQASDLLPLWQVLRTLTTSDAAAREEINAIVEQIQETMTADQLQAIDAMDLTNESIFSTMQELGIVSPQVNASGTPQPRGNFQGGGQGIPGGGPGPSGGGPGGFSGEDGQLSPEQIATAQTRRAENGGGFGNRMLSPLIEAVIDLLKSK